MRAVATVALLLAVAVLALALGLAGQPSLVSGVARPGAVSRRGLSSLPLAAQATISEALGAGQRAYLVSGSGDGYRAVNPVQGLRARFGRSGALLESGTARLGLSLSAVGYGASLTPVGPVRPIARVNRVVYGRPGLSEWYSNGPAGLEQGFTISRAPTGRAAGPLTLSLALTGDVQAAPADDGRSLTFAGARGASLRYHGLVATDARGRALHSWLELHDGRVLLHVDAHGASYPLRIDPLIQQGSKLTGASEDFGYSVALSSDGNTALIGGPYLGEGVGGAWVFTRTGSTWTKQAKLTAVGESGGGWFGNSVALSSDGNTALIGGRNESKNAGAAWVFTRSEGKWTQQGTKLTGTKEESGAALFGESVALSSDGNTALIGGGYDSKNAGAAWVFTRSEGTWTQQGTKLTGAKEESGEAVFGTSVALSSDGNTALIGGWGDSPLGAAWVFTRSEGKWTQQGTKLTGGKEESGDAFFGESVALSSDGNTALIGGEADHEYVGAAWVFTRSEGKWTQQGTKLTGGKEESGAGRFGDKVVLSADGNTALVGGGFNGKNAGAAWVFTRSEGTWTQQGAKLTGGKEESGEAEFGTALALSATGSTALIGGWLENSVWVFASGLSTEEGYGCENPGEPNIRWPCIDGTLNSATGNHVENQADMAVGGRGPGLHETRTYNSQLAAQQSKAGPFGYGWTGSYSANLVINEKAETATVHQDNGSAVTFTITPVKTYVGVGPWVQATLVKSGSSYIYTLPNQSKLEFDSEGRLSSGADRNGNVLSMTYNGKQLKKVTDGDGRSLTFTYSEGKVSKVTDPMGHVVEYKYVSENLAEVTIEKKVRWKFEYNTSHELTKMTDGREHSVKTEYESASPLRVSEQTIAGHEQQFKYGTLETTITDPNGSETVEDLDNGGLATKITRDANTGLASTTEYEYNNAYDLVSTIDPDGHRTEYGYDEAGNRTSEKDSNGDERKWKYDEMHDIETETTPAGETATIKSNANGDPEVIERPIGSETQKMTYAYDKQGDVTEETDPLKHTKKFEYDEAGDRKSETDPLGNKRTWEYNTDSQVIAEASPRKFTTKTERDEQGRPTKVTDSLGHTTKYVYDGNGNVETAIDGNGHTTKYEYNDENLPTKVTEANGDHPETEYDAEGETIGRTDGDGHKWKYVRNKLEEVVEEENPLKHITQKKYDQAGNLEKLVDPGGRTTTNTYDGSNRLKEVTYSSGNPATVKYEYDNDSHVIKMTDGTGKTVNAYDKLDRLTESKNGAGKLVKYEYNLVNEPTKITYPNNEVVTRAYDSDNRLEKVKDGASNETKFSYDADSNLTATIFPAASGDEDTYAYNEADQMVQVKMVKGATGLAGLIYTRDGDGQVKKTTTVGLTGQATSEEAYDGGNRLTEANGLAYTYDNANNPTKIEGKGTYAYDEAGELKEGPEAKYAYNSEGQRTETKPTKGPSTAYGHDQAGNLVSVKRPKEGETAEINDSYTYDGNDLRQSQTINGTTTDLTWDTTEGLPVILEDEKNNYIYGPDNLPIEQTNKEGKPVYLHHDQQGSTRLLTSETGNAEAVYSYSPYGVASSKGAATTPLLYDAQYTSTDTGLIYLRARTYDPKTAGFLVIDPELLSTGEPYSYAEDNPLNRADPTGRGWRDWLPSARTVLLAGATLVASGVALSTAPLGLAVTVPIVIASASATATSYAIDIGLLNAQQARRVGEASLIASLAIWATLGPAVGVPSTAFSVGVWVGAVFRERVG